MFENNAFGVSPLVFVRSIGVLAYCVFMTFYLVPSFAFGTSQRSVLPRIQKSIGSDGHVGNSEWPGRRLLNMPDLQMS